MKGLSSAAGRAFAAAAMATMMAAGSGAAMAQAWPAKPVRIVHGFPPGSAPDTVIRMIAEKFTPAMGQTFLIENRTGAAGTIAGTAVAQSAPDGYTLMLGVAANVTVAPHLLPSAKYNPTTDFAAIGLIQRSPYYIAVRTDVPINSFRELIATAKAKPGALNYASIGIGSQHHLTWEVMEARLGFKVTHIPLSGTAQAVAETLGGRTELIIDSAGTAFASQARAGKLRMLATTSAKPLPLFPDVMPVADQGLPGFESLAWWGLLAPAGTPAPIITRLNGELNKAVASADIADRLRQEGALTNDTIGNTPADFTRWIATEYERWGRVIKETGIKVQ